MPIARAYLHAYLIVDHASVDLGVGSDNADLALVADVLLPPHPEYTPDRLPKPLVARPEMIVEDAGGPGVGK